MLHSAVVAHKTDGFMFLGPSNAGKTTLATMSASIGCAVLGDEHNFIIPDQGIGYVLTAAPSIKRFPVGYSERRPPLGGIFRLVQDKTNFLVSIPPIEIAKTLFDAFMETPPGPLLSDELLARAFGIMGDIARRTPGYELHFCKSPDFWDVIDAEFGM